MDKLAQQSENNFAICAPDVSKQIEVGNLSEARSTLVKAGAGVMRHAKEIKNILERYEAVKMVYRKEEDSLTTKINEAHSQEKQAQSDKSTAEVKLELERSELRRYESELQTARNNYDEANRKRKDNNAGTVATSVVAGAAGLLTIFTFGAAAPLVPIAAGAAAAGATAGAIAFDKAADKAKDDMRRSEGRIRDARSKISSTESVINSLSNKLVQLSRDIECYNEKRCILHNEKERVTKVVVFLMDAQRYGKTYADVTEHCGRRTDLLKRLVDKAEKKSYSLFDSKGTERILTSFEEAWEVFQEMNEEGANYVFKVDFECSQCNCDCNELPQINNGQLICAMCFENI